MKYKNYYTALFPALIDRQGYYDMQKEMNFKSVENTMFNRFAGKSSFLAVVLPEDLNNTSNIPFNTEKSLRVRPLDVHDFIIPEPCSGRNQEEIKKIIAMHPVAYPDNTVPQGGSEEKADSGVAAGQVVECFFMEAGPDDAGSLRGLRYRLTKQPAPSSVDLSCIGGQEAGASDNFNGGGAQPNSQANYEDSDYKVKDPKAFTEAEQKYIKGGYEYTGDGKTIDGRGPHKPLVRTYQGKIAEFKGKQIKNGQIPIELLATSKAADGSHALFLVDVIDDFERLALAFKQQFGKKLYLTVESYRTFAEQIDMKNTKINKGKPSEAATPGESNHGWGLAFDFDTNYKKKKRFQSETYKWMLQNAPRFGFENPPKMQEGGKWPEAWHIQWKKISDIFKK